MEELKTLKRQFEASFDQFPKMIYLIKWFRIGVIKSESGFDPERPLGPEALAIINQRSHKDVDTPSKYEPTPDRKIEYWICDPASSYSKDFCEAHWLLRPQNLSWDKTEALSKLKTLAENIIAYLFDENANLVINSIFSEIGSTIINTSEETYRHIQGWLSVVHYLQPTKTIKRVYDAERNTLAAAEDGKPSFFTIDDVFLQSALACGRLLDLMKTTQAPSDNGSKGKPPQKSEYEKIALIAKYLEAKPYAKSSEIEKATRIIDSEVRRLWGPIKQSLKEPKRRKPSGTKKDEVIDDSKECSICQTPISTSWECRLCNKVIIGECKECHYTNSHPEDAIP